MRKKLVAALTLSMVLASSFANTAFAGTSISTLLLDYAYDLSYRQVINSCAIGLNIMRGLSGSFGVILCVPLTVLLASLLLPVSQKAEGTR